MTIQRYLITQRRPHYVWRDRIVMRPIVRRWPCFWLVPIRVEVVLGQAPAERSALVLGKLLKGRKPSIGSSSLEVDALGIGLSLEQAQRRVLGMAPSAAREVWLDSGARCLATLVALLSLQDEGVEVQVPSVVRRFLGHALDLLGREGLEGDTALDVLEDRWAHMCTLASSRQVAPCAPSGDVLGLREAIRRWEKEAHIANAGSAKERKALEKVAFLRAKLASLLEGRGLV